MPLPGHHRFRSPPRPHCCQPTALAVPSATLVLALACIASGQQPPPSVTLPAAETSTAADPSLFPAAVPPSAPEGLDPGVTPAVPIFGPHAGTAPNTSPPRTELPTTRQAQSQVPVLPPQVQPQPQPGSIPSGTEDGIRESDIRAYVIPEMDLTPVQTEPGGAVWERNAALAFHKAKTLQRPLLLLFTARWDTGCQKLSEEVFTSNTFNEFARDNCVICFIDYPRNASDATESMIQVRKKYQVRGLPSLLVFDPDGNVVRQITGYRTGRPVTYFNRLHEAVEPLAIHLEDRKKKLMEKGYRDWTNAAGTTVFATFSSHNGEKVLIRGPAGDRWILPIATLSKHDQALVHSFPTWAELHSEAAGKQ